MNPAQSDISNLIVFDDPVQTKINIFIKQLSELGLDKEQLETLGLSIASTASTQTIAKISAVMTDTDWDNWRNFINADPNPNTAQQIIVMNELLRQRTNKDLNTLFNEILDSIMKDTKYELLEDVKLRQKISKLSDEDTQKAMQLLEDGEFEELDKLLDQVRE